MDAPVERLLDASPVGVLATVRRDGLPRQSIVYFVRDGDRILISTESKRAKARDVERTGRASFCVQGFEKPFPSVTLEGAARISRHGIGEPTARIVARIIGAPIREVQTDEALAAADRVILELDVERVYGASYLESTS